MEVGRITALSQGPHVLDGLKARWPKDDLDYVRALATTLLALIILPLALLHLFLHPLEVADHAIKSRVA